MEPQSSHPPNQAVSSPTPQDRLNEPYPPLPPVEAGYSYQTPMRNLPGSEPMLTPPNIPEPAPLPNLPAAPPSPYQTPGVPTVADIQPPQTAAPVTNVQMRVNPNSTQNALQIAEIRDGIVIMNDGSYRSVIMVKSINFDLMSPQEREAVEYSYQGFLNSLYFPIQIFIHSRKVDLEPYIQKLDKIRTEQENMLLALLMQDYIGYMTQLALQTNIMDKSFYVVIPYFPVIDVQKALTATKGFFSGLSALFSNKQQHVTINEDDLEKAKDELRNRVQSVLAGLLQCGIQGLPLDTQELIELYYDVYNPDTATRQELKDFNSLSAPVITKGSGEAPQPNLERELQ